MALEPDRTCFDHVGVITDVPMPGARFEATGRSWVTNPRAHPGHVEWLCFEPDSPVTGPLRHQPHVAFRVEDVDAAIDGFDVLLEPIDIGEGFARSAFVLAGGAVVELMQYARSGEQGWWF